MVFAFFCAPAGYTTVPMVKIICITITQVALKRKKKNKKEYLFRTKILSKQVFNLMVELKHQRTADKK